jgi:hypothetical protein
MARLQVAFARKDGHTRLPTLCPVANSAVNPKSTHNLHFHCCAQVLRAPENFHFYKSHPHSVNPHFALRAVARKTPRARSATDNREERYMMFDHTHVHSCFGIHSPLDLRISSFTQALGFPPNPPGTPRDAGATQRDRAGLIGTALGPEKDGLLSPLADALATHNHCADNLLCLRPSKPYPSKHLFPRVPSTTLNAQRRSDAIHTLPWGDFREILGVVQIQLTL